MKVFLCWSGDRSKGVAETLGHWIGQVVQAVEPWISTQTDKGARWREEIGNRLEEVKVGIVCLTSENLDNEWIHFEAGALSKTKDAHVCTFLLDLVPTDVKEPLAQFQATKAEENDVRALIRTINKLVGKTGGRALPEKDLDEIFDLHWTKLRAKLEKLSTMEAGGGKPVRSETELLRETLEGVRRMEHFQRELLEPLSITLHEMAQLRLEQKGMILTKTAISEEAEKIAREIVKKRKEKKQG
jgi:hypothetical protein